MPEYNPNSVWESKEKKYEYTPPGGRSSLQPSGSIRPPDGAPLNSDEPKQPSFFRRHGLIFFTIGIFLAIGLAAFIYYLLLPPPTPNVVISFSNPGSITVGVPFPIIITVSNESKSVLENATLNIMLPGGISFASGTTPTQSVGTLSSQTINPPDTIWLVAGANSGAASIVGTTETLNTTLTYQTAETASTTYTASANTSLSIGTQSALTLSYNAPSSIFSGQNFDITVNYQNDTPNALQGVQLQMQYPPAYHFVMSSATLPIDAGNDTWNLGTLAANATGTLVITGNIVGPAQAHYQLTGTIGATFSGENYPAIAAPVSFVVTPSPLSLAIALNGSSTYIAKLGDGLNYVLTYTNNSNVAFKNVNISAVLTGSMYNLSSLKTSGSFNSRSNTITWFAANTPALASLAPGQSGTVDFTINTLQTFPTQLVSEGYKNYSLDVTATAVSPTVPPNTAGTNTTSITELTSKVGGEITLTANGYVKETTPGIANTGPYPPVVNQPTLYTIHWDIANYSTDATSVTISAYLQSGTTFTGVATSTGLASNTIPTYDAGTGLVSWTIPSISATTGVISPPVQAIFQVSNTPAVNQVGETVTLLGPTTLSAIDEYTGMAVTSAAPAVTTYLPNDPSVDSQPGDVTQ